MQVSPEEGAHLEASFDSIKKFAINTTVSNLNVDDAKIGADVTQLADRLLGTENEAKNMGISTDSVALVKQAAEDDSATIGLSAITPRAIQAPDGVHEVTPEDPHSFDLANNSIVDNVNVSSSPNKCAGPPESTSKLPVVDEQLLCREFTMQGLDGVEITSLDITSHGCYVLAGCGNGMVLLFDLTQKLKEPACVGQILAKGLHTNLLMTVKITEDCRYCFAGVTKGSSELLAVDLSRLPVWDARTGMGQCTRPYGFVNELVTCYSRSDPKLRGFGDAVRVRGGGSKATYRLASGLGIKNIHVWQFTPAAVQGEAPSWACMYDVATNGNTIEAMSFKMGGEYLSSKSAGANLRVWDLTGYAETNEGSNNKPAYEDIANTQDSRALLDDYALGGTYEFAIVNLKAPKAANRSAIEVPERSADDEEGNRRRRMMRQVSSITATDDCHHAVVLCADGGCLYFNKSLSTEVTGGKAGGIGGSLVELPSLPRDMDNLSQCTGRDWALKRVGYLGEVVLLRATQASKSEPVKVIVRPIYLESMYVPPTILDAPPDNSVMGPKCAWSEWGYFANPEAVKPIAPESESAAIVKMVQEGPAPSGETAPGTKKKGRKEKVTATSGVKADGRQGVEAVIPAPKRGPGAPRGRPPLAPSGVQQGGLKRPRTKEAVEQRAAAHKASNEEYRKSLQLPSAAKSSAFGYGYGFGQMGVNPEDCVDDEYKDYAFRYEQEPKILYKPLTIGPPPRARRVVEAPFKRSRYLAEHNSASWSPASSAGSDSSVGAKEGLEPKPKRPSVANIVMRRFRSLCKHWIQSQTRRARGDMGEILLNDGSHGVAAEVGVCTLRKLGELSLQQDRVRAQFIGEATRVIAKHLNTLNESHSAAYLSKMPEETYSHSQDFAGSDVTSPFPEGLRARIATGAAMDLPLGAAAEEMEAIIARYEGIIHELIERQQLEISATHSMDSLVATSMLFAQPTSTSRKPPRVIFRHHDCWGKARSFVGTVQLLVNSVIAQFRKEQGERNTQGENADCERTEMIDP